MSYDVNTVLQVAENEIGYLEKKTNAKLDDKTANAGDKNYTKYARDLDALGFYNGRKNGFAWCDIFVDWCFVRAYGLEAALKLTNQPLGKANCGAGCRYSRNYYKKAKRLFDAPQPGDQIFFWPKDAIGGPAVAHTGLVYRVDGTYVYTIEGNTSGANGVVANGGGVCKKKYRLTYNRIAGYGRPDWGGSSGRACGGSGCSESQAYSGEGEFREPARGRRREIRERRSREQGCAARMGRDGAKRLVRRAQGRAGGVDFGQVCGSRRR